MIDRAGHSRDTVPRPQILHLEDNRNDAELVRRMLAADGLACDITRVETRADFLEAMERGGPAAGQAWKLILADYALPAFDGLAALAEARRSRPELPFILVSGTLGEELAVESLQQGATDYVLKERLGRLAAAVRRALREAEEHAARRRTQAAFWESEEKYRTLVESALDGIVLTDPQGHPLYRNSAYVKSLGDRPRAGQRTAVSLQQLPGRPAAGRAEPGALSAGRRGLPAHSRR